MLTNISSLYFLTGQVNDMETVPEKNKRDGITFALLKNLCSKHIVEIANLLSVPL